MRNVKKPTYLTIQPIYKKIMRRRFVRSAIETKFRFMLKAHFTDDVITTFRQRYKTKRFMNILDGTTAWYLTPLYHCEAYFSDIKNDKSVLALDLGCGAASVCNWLRNNDYKWSYLGVDAAKEAGSFFETLDEAKFLSKYIQDLTKDDMPQKPDIIFAVNLFLFLEKINPVLENIHKISQSEAKLVIIDPIHSPLWNTDLKTYMRTHEKWIKTLEHTGWYVEKNFILSIDNILNKPVMLISQAFICSKKNPKKSTPAPQLHLSAD
jgi:SAM-dependent methyltransferase